MTRKQAKNPRPPKKDEHNGRSNADKSSSEDARIAQSRSAWNSGNKTALALFPDAELVETPMRDNDEEFEWVLQASLKSYEAQKQSRVRSRERNVEDAEENLDDDDYWSNNAHRNLPSPEHEKVKKAPDTNNNSAMKKAIDTTVLAPSSGSSATARNSRIVRERVKTFEEAIESIDESSTPEKPIVVDRYGRIGGQNERHIYMGSGGRKREAAYLEEQKKRGLLGVTESIQEYDKVKHDYESNRTKYNKSSQSVSNGENEVEKSPRSLRPEARSQCESIERASTDDRKPANHGRISSQRNVGILEASSSVKNRTRIEETRTDEIPAIEASKNETIQQSQDDSAKKPESKHLRITDFNSRHNRPKLAEEDNSAPTSRPELIKSPASIRRDTQKSNDDEGACAQVRIKTSDSSPRTYDPPPGFQAPSQHEIPNAPDALLQSEVLYDRLAVYDPSLYRLLVQKKMSELSLSNRTAIDSLQTVQENFVDYDNYPGYVDDRGDNTIDTFLTPEQAANFQDYRQIANSPRHMQATEFPHARHHGGYRRNFRPDDSASNYPNRQYPEGYPMARMDGTDVYVNVVPVPVPYLPPNAHFLQRYQPNFPPMAPNYGDPYNYSLMRNQAPLNVHQRPVTALNLPPTSQQGFCYPQENFPPPMDNHGRMFNRRAAFNPGYAGNINNYLGNRPPGKIPQPMQFPRENRGRARTQQNY